jgi:hypothetical protein
MYISFQSHAATFETPYIMLQMLGMEECQKRISKMVEQAKYEASVPLQKPLNALVSGATV